MSIYVTSAAWKNSASDGSTLLVLLAICDFCDDEGRAFPAVKTLAAKSRTSERTTQYAIQELIAMGELQVNVGTGPKGCNLYRVQVQNLRGAKSAGVQPDSLGGATGFVRGCSELHPNHHRTVNEPSLVPREKKKALRMGFDLTTGTFTNIDAFMALDLKKAYPSVSLDAEINRAAIWIIANPAKRPSSNFARFLTSWLARAQKDADSKPRTKKSASDILTGRAPKAPPFAGETFNV